MDASRRALTLPAAPIIRGRIADFERRFASPDACRAYQLALLPFAPPGRQHVYLQLVHARVSGQADRGP